MSYRFGNHVVDSDEILLAKLAHDRTGPLETAYWFPLTIFVFNFSEWVLQLVDRNRIPVEVFVADEVGVEVREVQQ